MKIVSVINYKGGVGKTTVTANLSAELARRGCKVLMIDLDPQASLTFSFIKPEVWKDEIAISKTIKNWFTPNKKESVKFEDLIIPVENNEERLFLLSSHLELINVDLELATQLGGANLQQAKKNFIKVHRRLAEGIQSLSNSKYDIILIDCPPNFNIVTKNSLVASNYILIPAKPDYLSTMGIDYLIKSLDSLVKDYNEYCNIEDDEDIEQINPEISGVLFTMVQIYGSKPIAALRPFISQTKQIKREKTGLQIPVFDNYIRENKTLFAAAPQYGIPVVLTNDYKPDIIEGIKDFVDEFSTKILL
jgi:chromosome partitioning protein